MIKKVFECDMISFFEDSYMEENKLLRGRKQNSNLEFIIGCPYTISKLHQQFISEKRDEKIDSILNDKS
jgi:hypothetical protein